MISRNTERTHRPEMNDLIIKVTQSAFTCSKLTIETLEQGVKCIQS